MALLHFSRYVMPEASKSDIHGRIHGQRLTILVNTGGVEEFMLINIHF
jgi:hypothetical protein